MVNFWTMRLVKSREIRLKSRPVKTVERFPWPRMTEDKKTPLGIDVIAKQQDIIKIVHKYFKVVDISMDELLQEVFLAIVHKNFGKSAHNPTKSSFGHYVYMVANNVCINLVHRKHRYSNERDSLDAPNGPDDPRTLLDTVDVPIEEGDPVTDRMEAYEEEMRRIGRWDVARYVCAVRTGANPDIIREALTFGNRVVTTKTIRDLRLQVQDCFENLQID
jgi:hypothetical protein